PVQSWSASLRAGDIPPLSAASREFGAGDVGSTRNEALPAQAFVDYFRRLDPVQRGFVYSEVKQALAKDDPELLKQDIVDRSAAPRHADHDGEILPVIRRVADILQVH